MDDLPRLRRHTDGRLAVLADPGDRWPWLCYPPGPLAPPGGVDWLGDATVHEEGWSELVVVELPEPTSVEPDHVAWRGAELHIIRPGGTSIWPSLPDDQDGWDDAPSFVRKVVVPALLAAALWAEHEATGEAS